MTVDPSRFERLVDSLERTTLQLAEVAGELKVVAERQSAAAGAIQRLEGELDGERMKRIELEAKLDRWINRGWGAWGVLVLAFTLFTALDDRLLPAPSPSPRDLPVLPAPAGK